VSVVCILEGYAQIGAIGSPHFVHGSVGAGLFTVMALIAITRVVGLPGGGRDRMFEGPLIAACALLAPATIAAMVVPGPTSSATLGVSDLLVALAVLATAAVLERRRVRQDPPADTRRPID
jgi:hypothetical protein